MDKNNSTTETRCFSFKPLIIWLVVALILLIAIDISVSKLLDLDHSKNFELVVCNAILSLLISGVIVYIAYARLRDLITQSERSNAQQRINYLLRIDERWSSQEIIKAREVIHEFYLSVKNNKELTNLSNMKIAIEVGKEVMKIKDDSKNIGKFISLLNFLDFLETIGYLRSRDAIDIEEINELCGNSIKYFYKVFEEYIHYRRREKDPTFYMKFEDLNKEIINLEKQIANNQGSS